jgi:hypothetical protein
MLPLGQAPAIPLDTAGKYVAAAYLVFFAIILIYVAVMAARVSRMERDLAELDALVPEREEPAIGRVAAGTSQAAVPAGGGGDRGVVE